MEPLMYETYNPQNQTKYVNAGLFLPLIQKIYLKGKDNHSYIVTWINELTSNLWPLTLVFYDIYTFTKQIDW